MEFKRVLTDQMIDQIISYASVAIEDNGVEVGFTLLRTYLAGIIETTDEA